VCGSHPSIGLINRAGTRLSGAETEKSFAGAGRKEALEEVLNQLDNSHLRRLAALPAQDDERRVDEPHNRRVWEAPKRHSQTRLFFYGCCKIEHVRLFATYHSRGRGIKGTTKHTKDTKKEDGATADFTDFTDGNERSWSTANGR